MNDTKFDQLYRELGCEPDGLVILETALERGIGLDVALEQAIYEIKRLRTVIKELKGRG